MRGPGLLGVAMLVAGTSLLGAGLGRAASGSPGGTLRIVSSDPAVFPDPTVAATRLEWQLGYVTGIRLLEHPDVRGPRGWDLVPGGAAALPRISRDGKTYTFRIRRGLRFSDGRPVRAAHFAYALNRSLQPDIDFPAAPFLVGPGGIVGAGAVATGKRRTATGIEAHGNTLVLRLDRANPAFTNVLAYPFFQATPLRLPPDAVTFASHGLASAGPYHVVASDQDTGTMTLRRNPYYRGSRPHAPDEIQVRWRVPPDDALAAVESGAADYTADLPAAAHAQLAERYGIAAGRYRVNPGSCLLYLALDPESGLFRNNARLRRAVGFAIDRRAMVDAYNATYGAYASSPTDQYVPPGFPGYVDADVYPLDGPDVARAGSLAAGRTRGGAAIYVRANRSPLRELLEVNRADFGRIGVQLTAQPARGRRPAPNVVPSVSCATSRRPEFFQDVFGGTLPLLYRKALARALSRPRAARTRAVAALDATIARNDAPGVAWGYANDRELFSDRVDVRSIVHQPAYDGVDLAALRLR